MITKCCPPIPTAPPFNTKSPSDLKARLLDLFSIGRPGGSVGRLYPVKGKDKSPVTMTRTEEMITETLPTFAWDNESMGSDRRRSLLIVLVPLVKHNKSQR